MKYAIIVIAASVNGGWSSWVDNTQCTTPGQLTYAQIRNCNAPAPAYGGLQCTLLAGGTGLEDTQSLPCSK